MTECWDDDCLRVDAHQGLRQAFLIERQKREDAMSAAEIANTHFSAAMAAAQTAGVDQDSVCRSLVNLVVSKYLETRTTADVQSELRFVADNCDPDTDFAFMRP
jgi:uncharacterized iron-regulated protein